MRFITMHKIDKTTEAGLSPPPQVMAAMGQFMQDLASAGAFGGGEGLRPSSHTVRVKFSGGRRSIQRGPFPVSNGLIAGFTIIRATSMDEAIEWATRYAAIVGDVEIDIGVVNEPWDLGMMPKPEGLTTTRFMIMHKANSETESGALPRAEVVAGVRKLTEEMVKAGVFISAEALEPSSNGVRLNYAHGECVMTDGPFSESKELIAGYGILHANSREQVIEWSQRFAAILAAEGEIEIDVRLLREPGKNG